MTDLDQRVCLVTGASSGIGAATCRTLAALGAQIVATARRADRLDALAAEVRAAGGRIRVVPADIADRAAVEAAVKSVAETEGRLDILINNAGVMPLAPMCKTRIDDWDRMIDVNIKGLLYGIGFALPIMLAQGDGHIVNVSSVAGRRLFSGATVYCGTKHAVHAISDGLREELADRAREDGNTIRVTVLAPGAVLTELHDSVTDPDTRTVTAKYYENFKDPLTANDMAEAIRWALAAPAHMNVNEILVRPVRQVK